MYILVYVRACTSAYVCICMCRGSNQLYVETIVFTRNPFFFKKSNNKQSIRSRVGCTALQLPSPPLPTLTCFSKPSLADDARVYTTVPRLSCYSRTTYIFFSNSSVTVIMAHVKLGSGVSITHTPSLPPTSSPTTTCATSSERRDGGGGLREAPACETRENFFQFGKYLFLYRKHLAHTGDEPSCSHKCCRDSL